MPSQYQRLYDEIENDLEQVFKKSRHLNHDARQDFLHKAQSDLNKEVDVFINEHRYEE